MKRYEKETAQAFLDNEKEVLKSLDEAYADAIARIDDRIAYLLGRADADMSHVIYQVEYQRMLKGQIESILRSLQTEEFETVSEYLTHCYEEGFIGALYAMQQQGVPLVFPINQEQVARAIRHETNLSTTLYAAFDIGDLQKKIANEISRGFASAAPFAEIARNVANQAKIGRNNAMRIVRTEGHRITETAAHHAQKKAQENGAEIVKIWDAALDHRTRPSHARLDGEIRELDEPFSNGLMYPGDRNGKAKEVINCRCRSRSDSKWLLEADETKMLGDVSKMSQKQKEAIADKLGVPVDDLEQYSRQIVPVRAKSYDDFKRQYNQLWHYEGSDVQRRAEARISNRMASDTSGETDWSGTRPREVTRTERDALMQHAQKRGVNIVDLSQFDGDPKLLETEIDTIARMQTEFEGMPSLTVTTSNRMDDDDFAEVRNRTICFNTKALRDAGATAANMGAAHGFAGQTVEDIAVHEFGHIIAGKIGNIGIETARQAYYNVHGEAASDNDILMYLRDNVSQYSVTSNQRPNAKFNARRFHEVIPEVLAKNNSDPDAFTEAFAALIREMLSK